MSLCSYGLLSQHSPPIGLIRRRRRKGRMRTGCRKEHEHRRALPRLELQRVEARHHELIGDRPPAECRPFVVEPLTVVDRVEPIEDAFGPALLQSRHHRDRAVAAPRERRDQRVALRAHQQDVCVLIADLESRQQADVSQPRVAAEGGRLHERRHDIASGGADVRLPGARAAT